MAENIIKIVPSPKELQITNQHSQGPLTCSERGCNYVAPNTSILGLHRAHLHKIRTSPGKGSVAHYHCPVTDCYFGPRSERYLKNLDILRTHYMKTHAERKFMCEKCSKAFGLERDCHRHQIECGQNFSCPECNKSFTHLSALIRHCDYQRHTKPEKKVKLKEKEECDNVTNHQDLRLCECQYQEVRPVKEKPAPKPRVKKKKNQLVKKVQLQPFILPKHMPPLQNSLDIQTDALGAQVFILPKVTPAGCVSQGVQTINKLTVKRSAGIQTNLDVHRRSHLSSYQPQKLSTGIQTASSTSAKFGDNLCVAQTQTKESILQKAMTAAGIRIIKVCKGTQKSSSRGTKRKLTSSAKCTNESQTNIMHTNMERKCLVPPAPDLAPGTPVVYNQNKTVKLEFETFVDSPVSNMSTQTNLSCVPEQIQPQLPCIPSSLQLQDCHTQTHIHIDKNATLNQTQTSQTNLLGVGHEQMTLKVSSDQHTQTSVASKHSLDHSDLAFLTIQDSQTQTQPANKRKPDLIQNIHTQTQISGLVSKAQVQDQATGCDDPFSMDLQHLLTKNSKQMSTFSTQTDPANILSQVTVHQSSVSADKDNFATDTELDLLEEGKLSPTSTVRTSDSTEALTSLLMEVIHETEKSFERNKPSGCGCSVHSESVLLSFETLRENFSSDIENEVSMANMETQTFGQLAMDSMTQTLDDLEWSADSQPMEDLFTDMMTQTGDDLLEFLTNDSQTQTLNSFCEIASSSDQVCDYLNTPSTVPVVTTDNATQINLDNSLADNASTQTVWEMDGGVLDFQSGSFSAPENIFLNQTESETHKHAETFLEKEQNTFENFNTYTRNLALNTSSGNYETTGTQIYFPGLTRAVETSETQTMYDPLFASLGGAESGSPHLSGSIKDLESSHTQTSSDPMLSAVKLEDDFMLLSQENIFLPKETAETQTVKEEMFPAVTRETVDSQTQWDVLLTSVGTSETQTDGSDFFCVSYSDIHTQTNLGPELMANLDLTDSFTQTSLDQNTQTNSLFDF